MIRDSEEILLDEVKAEYTRQLSSWTDLSHRSSSFLQLNGIVLSIIFLGINFTQAVIVESIIVLLLLASVFIIFSIAILAAPAIHRVGTKDINIEINGVQDMKGKEHKIALALINQYLIAQKDVISKYENRLKLFSISVALFSIGIGFLLTFITVLFLNTVLT